MATSSQNVVLQDLKITRKVSSGDIWITLPEAELHFYKRFHCTCAFSWRRKHTTGLAVGKSTGLKASLCTFKQPMVNLFMQRMHQHFTHKKACMHTCVRTCIMPAPTHNTPCKHTQMGLPWVLYLLRSVSWILWQHDWVNVLAVVWWILW